MLVLFLKMQGHMWLIAKIRRIPKRSTRSSVRVKIPGQWKTWIGFSGRGWAFNHLCQLSLYVTSTGPQGVHIFAQTLSWVFLWVSFRIRLTFQSADWASKLLPQLKMAVVESVHSLNRTKRLTFPWRRENSSCLKVFKLGHWLFLAFDLN